MTLPVVATPLITALVGLVAGVIVSWIKEEYVPIGYKERQINFEKLKTNVREVKKLLRKLQEISKAEDAIVLTKEAPAWMSKAEEAIKDVNINELNESLEARGSNSTYCLMLPNYCRRCDASCTIERANKKVDELIEEQESFELELVVRGYSKKMSHGENKLIRARSEVVEKIWQSLCKRHDIRVICINGMAGVGKTEIAKAINNLALNDEDETFKYVIWLDVGFGTQYKNLQDKIAKCLNIKLSPSDGVASRASTLRTELRKRESCLLILDSLWADISLQKVAGIIEEDVIWKVIFTSRLPNVGLKNIATDEHFEIKPLCEKKSRKLLDKIMGSKNNLSRIISREPRLQEMLEKAVKDCGGLPLFIHMLAQHLGSSEGQESLGKIHIVLKEILDLGTTTLLTIRQLKELKYSYRCLKKKHRKCFLYFALYPKGYQIGVKQLIDYWIGEDLLDSYNQSLDERRAAGMNVLKQLQEARLLKIFVDGSKATAVKMVDVFHDVAMSIIREQGMRFLSKAGKNLTHFPEINDQHGETERVSFVHNKLQALTREPKFPALSAMLLHDNQIKMVSCNFFSSIPNLKVLDLSYTDISSLPQSISHLNHLQVLRLHNCRRLKLLPSLSNLDRLIVLDLFRTLVEQLPLGIEMLRNLRHLNLSRTKLTEFPANLLLELAQLQELLIIMDDAKAYRWGSAQVGSTTVEQEEAFDEHLAHLGSLTTLHLNFFNIEVFRNYMSVIPAPRPCSPSFKFCVGGACTKGDLLGENSIAFIDDYDRVDQLPEETLELYLTMYKRSLRTIERSSINFQTLRVIDVSHYRWLTYLFSIEMVRCLQCLEKISIRHCWSMLGLIDNSHKTDLLLSCSLPRLQELVLIDLPLLQSTCSEEVELKWPAFQSLIVWQCDKLTKLPRVVSQDGNAIQFDVRGRSSWVSSLVLLDGFHPSNFKEDNKEPEEITFDRVKEIEPMPTESPNDDRGAISETRAVERSGSRRSHSYTNVFDACFLGEIEPR